MGKCQCKHSNNTRRKYKQMWRLKKSINLSEALASTSPLAEQQGRRQRGVVLVEKGCAIGWWRRRLGISARHCRLRFFITAAVVVAAFVSKFKVAKVQFTFYPLYIAVLACKWFSLNKLFRFLCTVKSCCLFFCAPVGVCCCMFVCWLFTLTVCCSSRVWVLCVFLGNFSNFNSFSSRRVEQRSSTNCRTCSRLWIWNWSRASAGVAVALWAALRCMWVETWAFITQYSTGFTGYQSYFCSFCDIQ